MTKRYIRILTVWLLLCFLPGLGLAAVTGAEETAITVTNSGFEEEHETESGWVKSWTHMDTTEATFLRDTTKEAGESYLYIATENENLNPWAARAWIYGLEECALYEVSVFINANVSGNKGASTKLEFYDADGGGLPASSQIPNVYPNGQYIGNTNDRWVEHKTIFYVPEGTFKAKLYLRLHGAGDAWFDDVSIKFSGGPQKYTFDTNKVFHYKEETDGYAYVKIASYYEDSDVAENTLVDFVVYKENQENDDTDDAFCEGKSDVTFQNLEAGFTYSISYMVPYEKYVLKCTIKDSEKRILEAHTQNLYVVDRPSMMSRDGYLTVDGARFNPVLGYHVNKNGVNYYDMAIEAGINTVQVSTTGETDWDEMRKKGLKGVLVLYYSDNTRPFEEQCAGAPSLIERTKTIVEKIKNDSSFVGIAIMDEPFLSGDKPLLRDYMERAYLEIRKIDKMHPVFVCDKRNDHISSKYCDIYCIDSYAMGTATTSVSRETANAYAATKDKNSFWELAATYYEPSGDRLATMNSARNSVWRAFEEGARGIGYFALCDGMAQRPGFEGKEQLSYWEEWEQLCKFNKEEVPILFDYFVNDKGTPFNDYDDGDGFESMKWFSWLSGEDMYLAIHNRSKEEQTVAVPLRNKDGTVSVMGFRAVPVGLTTQSEKTGIGEISVTLASEEIALYKIIPHAKNITVQRSYNAEHVTLICALYAHSGINKELIALEMAEGTSQNGETVNLTSTIALPATGGGTTYTLDVMAWDMQAMKLIDEKTVLK